MVTASQVASITGQCPYKSAVQLLKEKVWPELRDNSSSFATTWGNNHEADAIKKYEKLTGKRILDFGLLQHPKYDWIGASPDGVAAGGPDEEPVAIEVKCPVSREITKEVPPHYMPQARPRYTSCFPSTEVYNDAWISCRSNYNWKSWTWNRLILYR